MQVVLFHSVLCLPGPTSVPLCKLSERSGTVWSTRINPNLCKTADLSHITDYNQAENANQKRTNMLEDAPDCTILMSISQFCADQLALPEDQFMQLCNWETATHVWWLFRNALGRGPTDNEKKKARKAHSEEEYPEEYPAAWVRQPNTLSCLCR